ncbi:TPA: hypothetical protein I8V91_002468 [Corynebacterium striatum]|nr:hypothetical protein [Corynebacterium striatum]HAT1254556.1 hypothetical protein [Corynebacterium striatum]HAT1267093.1 hypothetical protein [Corynebacterium striatum]HAT1296288.1 hypothetical protein [Corynebacterium striatum]HAT1306513.1 hypothetical protein [Corynebacterium striatum]
MRPSREEVYSACLGGQSAGELIKAHDALDREVDKAFGASRKLTTERQRQELLFANYEKLISNQ